METSFNEQNHNLAGRILSTCRKYPDRTALSVCKEKITYQELLSRATSIASVLSQVAPAGPPFLPIYVYRSVSAYASLLGALFHGFAYVPLNPRFPVERNRRIIEKIGARCILVDHEGEASLAGLCENLTASLTLICLDSEDVSDLRKTLDKHRVIGRGELGLPKYWEYSPIDPQATAYVLFTSGSTGEPKGVMITHRNIVTFVDILIKRYDITVADKIFQFADLTFDPSADDMFTAWFTGAELCCPSHKDLLNPAKYFQAEKITKFHSVPSNGLLMNRLGSLKPGSFPHLRVSCFGGEPFPVQLAQLWSQAAPNSILENLYGPTECTVDATAYRWDPERSSKEAENGLVPIGHLLPGFGALVVDEELKEVPPGEKGELLLCGPQVSKGYVGDEERTAQSFICLPGRREVFYRTGDLVRRPIAEEPYKYLGRLDQQIKIFGFRIELGEIESALREATGIMDVAALGWPKTQTGVEGIVAFIGSDKIDLREVRSKIRDLLPKQMLPGEIRLINKMPLNSNGKTDRKALLEMLEKDRSSETPSNSP